MQTVLITGGTGFVGKQLSNFLLEKGYSVIVLSRSADKPSERAALRYARWDPAKNYIAADAIQSADFIIHLAGAGVVDKKWTDDYKKEIIESRTESSKLILESLAKYPNHVRAIVSASAIGWYGPDKEPGHSFIEEEPPADDFLGQTCKLWEYSITPSAESGIRICRLRTGIVLGNEGGALAEFKKPIRFGIAGILSSGKQVVSWIHVDDLCRMYLHAIENIQMQGSYNAVAPHPVTNKKLTVTLAREMRGQFFIPMHVPSFILKIMMGSRSIEVLKSTTVSANKIKESGFTFLYPSIESAIQALEKK